MTDSLVGDATQRRLFAAGIDNLLAMFFGLLAASRLPEIAANDRVGIAVGTYLLYFLLQEGGWSNTLGKRLFGLRICRMDGSACGWGAALVRTATRVVEANPVLFGGLPAALTGAFSKRHQRVGEMLSGCLVVRTTSRAAKDGDVQQADAADEAR
jgi:uncharacterized RDD family membrane protein YckC